MAEARRAEGAGAGAGATATRESGAEAAGPVGAPRAWTVAAVSLMVGVAATLAVLSVTGTFDDGAVHTVVEQVEAEVPATAASEAQVADQVGPALVRVVATHGDDATSSTGVIYRSDGHLLTTADAVLGADGITVALDDGSVLAATVVGVDESTDVAVLDVDRDDMPTAVLGRVSDLSAGERAVALERPPESGSPSVAAGHLSALGIRLDTTDGTSLHDMIQAALDAVPSSSGAVLCSLEGAVLGLVTDREPAAPAHLTPTSTETSTSLASDAGAAPETGMSTLYATPIDYAAQLADEIIATGAVRHPWLGVLGDDLDPTAAAQLGRSGAVLTRVMPDGPAAASGLEEGDVVLAIDGVQVTSMSSLVVALRSHHDGDVVSLTFVRDGDQHAAMVTLTSHA
jgi:S1-C subfamily serine protease